MPNSTSKQTKISYQLIHDQIILCEIECQSLEAEFNEHFARIHLTKIKELLNGKPACLLIDARNASGGFKVEALKIVASDDVLNKLIIAQAFVTNALSTHLIFSFYKRVFLNNSKSEIFKNIASAKEYCLSFITK